jgi:hypothetical protein
MAFAEDGLRRIFLKNEQPSLIPAENSGIDILSAAMGKRPSHMIEALVVVPNGARPFDRLDGYNAIGRIRNIQCYLIYYSARNTYRPIFEETTRIESDKKRNPIPDPPPARTLPLSETMYLRFRDARVGNLFIRGDMVTGGRGMTFSITNFASIHFLIFTVMRSEKLSIAIYMEPVEEGMLIYSISAIDVPDFLASRTNIIADMNRRFTLLIQWIRDGLRSQSAIVQ